MKATVQARASAGATATWWVAEEVVHHFSRFSTIVGSLVGVGSPGVVGGELGC